MGESMQFAYWRDYSFARSCLGLQGLPQLGDFDEIGLFQKYLKKHLIVTFIASLNF